MRLHSMNSEFEAMGLEKFSYWVTAVGDSLLGCTNDRKTNIDILNDIYLKLFGDSNIEIVKGIYPLLMVASDDLSYIQDIAILARIFDVIDFGKQYTISMNISIL